MRWRGRLALAALALCGGTLFSVRASSATEVTSPRTVRANAELSERPSSGDASAKVHYAPLFDKTARADCLARVASSRAPLLVVVGASFTAGTGATSPRLSWAVDLAHLLGWRAVVAGIPGVGYVHRGAADDGPLSELLAMVDLAGLGPRLVLIQGGHDDMHEPAARVASAVGSLWRHLERVLPHSTLGAITVFARGAVPSARAKATDRTIVHSIRSIDPQAIVMDPLAADWTFARSPDRLHPSTLGDLEIAHLVARHLSTAGIVPAGAQPAPVCVLTEPYPLDAASAAAG